MSLDPIGSFQDFYRSIYAIQSEKHQKLRPQITD